MKYFTQLLQKPMVSPRNLQASWYLLVHPAHGPSSMELLAYTRFLQRNEWWFGKHNGKWGNFILAKPVFDRWNYVDEAVYNSSTYLMAKELWRVYHYQLQDRSLLKLIENFLCIFKSIFFSRLLHSAWTCSAFGILYLEHIIWQLGFLTVIIRQSTDRAVNKWPYVKVE